MDVTIIRSNRKTIAIQVNSDLSVTVRVPRLASQKDIDRILQEKESWICKHIEEMKKKKEKYDAEIAEKLTYEELKALADKALDVIPGRVEYFAKQIGVTYGRITIRNQKTRWGSCSSKGNAKYITPFYYCNATDIFTEGKLDGVLVGIGVAVLAVSFIVGGKHYCDKDLAA